MEQSKENSTITSSYFINKLEEDLLDSIRENYNILEEITKLTKAIQELEDRQQSSLETTTKAEVDQKSSLEEKKQIDIELSEYFASEVKINQTLDGNMKLEDYKKQLVKEQKLLERRYNTIDRLTLLTRNIQIGKKGFEKRHRELLDLIQKRNQKLEELRKNPIIGLEKSLWMIGLKSQLPENQDLWVFQNESLREIIQNSIIDNIDRRIDLLTSLIDIMKMIVEKGESTPWDIILPEFEQIAIVDDFLTKIKVRIISYWQYSFLKKKTLSAETTNSLQEEQEIFCDTFSILTNKEEQALSEQRARILAYLERLSKKTFFCPLLNTTERIAFFNQRKIDLRYFLTQSSFHIETKTIKGFSQKLLLHV